MSEIKSNVSGTAFVVNYSRSKKVDISKDIYAKFWVTPEAIELWNDLSKNVYPNDDLNLSLRNRFYLEHLKKFISENKNSVFADIASGFDDYPFLVEDKCKFMEFDLPNIINYKKLKIQQRENEATLPERKVEYFPIDLNDENQRSEMEQILSKQISGSLSLIIMEGLTYYLQKDVLTDLFRIFSEVQTKNSLIAFDYWKPDAMTYPVMVKLRKYLENKFGFKQDYNLFEENYISSIKGYEEIESKDIAELELEYSVTRIFQGRDNKIPVYFSVMKRE